MPAVIGFLLVLISYFFPEIITGATLLNSAVFGAAISYVLIYVFYIVLRRREPDLDAPTARRAAS